MQFVYPAFLFGLLTLAIPLIIHLFHFRRYQKVYFSNVQFLKNIQQRQSSRKNLKKRLILLMRLLALLFLVLAFARPFIASKQQSGLGKQHVISVFVDNSYSMQTLNRDGSLFETARAKAKEIVSAYGLNDRFQLLTQDFEGKQQHLVNRDEFIDELDKISISPQSHKIQQIINRQQSLLNTQPGVTKAIYIVSDFQKNLVTATPVKADEGISINLVKLKAATFSNLAIDSVWLLNAVHRPGESEKLVVRLHNYGDEKAEKVPLKLLINGLQKALGSYTFNAREVQNDTLAFSGLQAGWQQAELNLQDNPISFDNHFYFSFNVQKQMPLLLVDGGIPNKYASAVFNADVFFKPVHVTDGSVDYAGLAAYPLVVLNDIKAISTGLAQQLKTYVAKGGTLMVFPAADADLSTYKALLEPLGVDYPEKLITEKNKVSIINLQSPVFKNIFEQVPQNPDLPIAEKYYQYTNLSRSSRESLLQFAGKDLFLGDYRSGKGTVYVSAVPLNDDYSNLAHHAILVPLLFKIALLCGHDQSLFYTIGTDEMAETLPVNTSNKQILKLSKGDQTIIPDVRQQDGVTLLYFSDQVTQPGSYQLKLKDSLISVLSFNSNQSESDLSYLDDAALKAKVGNTSTILQTDGLPLKEAIAKTNIGIELWKLCIILTLICLAAEILLIRYYKPDSQVVVAPA